MTHNPYEFVEHASHERTVDYWFTATPEKGLEGAFHVWQTDLPPEIFDDLDRGMHRRQMTFQISGREWTAVALGSDQPGDYELRMYDEALGVIITVDAYWASLDELVEFAANLSWR